MANSNTKKKKGWKRKDWEAKAIKAGIKDYEKMSVAGIRATLKRLKNEGKIQDGRNENGGKDGMGRKPLEESKRRLNAQEEYEFHMNEIVDVVIRNNQTQQFTTTKVSTLKAMLDTLREIGLKQKDVRAIVAYLDRVAGKPKQMVEHSGDIKVEEQSKPTRAEIIGAQAYLDALEEEEELEDDEDGD